MPEGQVFPFNVIGPLNRQRLVGPGTRVQGNSRHEGLKIQMMDRIPHRLESLGQMRRDPLHILFHATLKNGEGKLRRNVIDGIHPPFGQPSKHLLAPWEVKDPAVGLFLSAITPKRTRIGHVTVRARFHLRSLRKAKHLP